MEEYVTEEKLKEVCNVRELDTVTYIEMKIDTRERSVSALGRLLPRLLQLKLNHSVLHSIRDLGTSLTRLQVLWVARCDLHDLEGVSMLEQLSELYAAFNELSDLSAIAGLEKLSVLDVEGNAISDMEALAFLQLTPRLTTLTTESNPIGHLPQYRRRVLQQVPQLAVLDDIDVSADDRQVPPLHTTSAKEAAADERMVLDQKIKAAPRIQLQQEDGVTRFTATTANKHLARRPASAGPSSTLRRPHLVQSLRLSPHMQLDARGHSQRAMQAMLKRTGTTIGESDNDGSNDGDSEANVDDVEGDDGTLHGSGSKAARMPMLRQTMRWYAQQHRDMMQAATAPVRPSPPPRPHTALAAVRAPPRSTGVSRAAAMQRADSACSSSEGEGSRRSGSSCSAASGSSSSSGSSAESEDAEDEEDGMASRCSQQGSIASSQSRGSSRASMMPAEAAAAAAVVADTAAARQLTSRLGPLGITVLPSSGSRAGRHAAGIQVPLMAAPATAAAVASVLSAPQHSGSSGNSGNSGGKGICTETGLAPAPYLAPVRSASLSRSK